MNTIEIYRDKKNEFRWRMLAENNEPLCHGGEGFKTVQGLKKNLYAIFGIWIFSGVNERTFQSGGWVDVEWPAKTKSPAKKKNTKQPICQH